MELLHSLMCVGLLLVLYLEPWIGTCHGVNVTDTAQNTTVTPMPYYNGSLYSEAPMQTDVVTEIVTELVTYMEDIVTVEPVESSTEVGLWVAIGVVAFAALVVFLTLLATAVLRWKRKDETSYDVERDENEHTNPAFEAGEIAGLEPNNGMQEVRIGLTTFADEDSKAVL